MGLPLPELHMYVDPHMTGESSLSFVSKLGQHPRVQNQSPLIHSVFRRGHGLASPLTAPLTLRAPSLSITTVRHTTVKFSLKPHHPCSRVFRSRLLSCTRVCFNLQQLGNRWDRWSDHCFALPNPLTHRGPHCHGMKKIL